MMLGRKKLNKPLTAISMVTNGEFKKKSASS
jgi:hypothetical protein